MLYLKSYCYSKHELPFIIANLNEGFEHIDKLILYEYNFTHTGLPKEYEIGKVLHLVPEHLKSKLLYKKIDLKNYIEYAVNDGNQMSYFDVQQYTGVDISEYIINICKQKYSHLVNKKFITYDEYYKISDKFDLALSLDVIYHLVDDNIYEKYMNDLFKSSNKFVIIYSTNNKETYNGSHVYHRKFTDYIDVKFPQAKLLYHEPNLYPQASSAEFFVYQIF